VREPIGSVLCLVTPFASIYSVHLLNPVLTP